MTKEDLKPIKGFRDFYPQQWAIKNWLFTKMRQTARLFGFQEYEGPTLEKLSLYQVKSGELAKQQAFTLQDKKGRKLALRPELTPTLARLVSRKKEHLTFPLRWFSIGKRWRYEKPQKGRCREFFQWDVDLVGPRSPEADAEVIAVACKFFEEIGLSEKEIVIKINSRKLMEGKLDLIEIPKTKIPAVFRAIDKKEKMRATRWREHLREIGLDSLQIRDLEGILKDEDFSGESEELTAIFATLADFGFERFIKFDPKIVRGLDYYTGVVFEAWERKGELRAILGGGRYDNLLEAVGGPPLSGVGFAAGDLILEEILRKYNKLPAISPLPTKILVTVFSEELYRSSLEIVRLLRNWGIPSEFYFGPEKLEKQLKYANRKGIPFVLILGPKELEKKVILLRNMKTGEQKNIPQAGLEKLKIVVKSK